MRSNRNIPADPRIFSFDVNLENPFSIIQEESLEAVDSDRPYLGSNLCGVVDLQGNSMPWGRRDLLKDQEYLCIGCSCTVSMGLVEEYSWPSLVRAFTGAIVNNISSPGAGIEFICSAAIDSFQKYGKPKTVLALFPDLYRLWTLSPDACSSLNMSHTVHASWHTEVREYFLDVRHSLLDGNDRPDIAKPFMFKNGGNEKTTFSVDRAIFNSFTMLDALMYFCKINNIDFRFTSWENEANKTLSNLSHYKNNYIPPIISDDMKKDMESKLLIQSTTELNNSWWDEERTISDVYRVPWRRIGISNECDHYPQTDYQIKHWSVAGDEGKHPGIHDQIHFAECLLGSKIDNNFLRTMP